MAIDALNRISPPSRFANVRITAPVRFASEETPEPPPEAKVPPKAPARNPFGAVKNLFSRVTAWFSPRNLKAGFHEAKTAFQEMKKDKKKLFLEVGAIALEGALAFLSWGLTIPLGMLFPGFWISKTARSFSEGVQQSARNVREPERDVAVSESDAPADETGPAETQPVKEDK